MDEILPKLKRLPSSRYSSILPYQLAQVKSCFHSILPPACVEKIVDANCHIGGDLLHFSMIYPEAEITAIDCDPIALQALKYNVENFTSDPSRFTLVHEDCCSYIRRERPKADFFYFDFTWVDF